MGGNIVQIFFYDASLYKHSLTNYNMTQQQNNNNNTKHQQQQTPNNNNNFYMETIKENKSFSTNFQTFVNPTYSVDYLRNAWNNYKSCPEKV